MLSEDFNHKNLEAEIFSFFVITFEPIKKKTRSAPQNDRLNLSFVKDDYGDGGKLARNGRKTAIFVSRKFWLSVSIFDSFLTCLARNLVYGGCCSFQTAHKPV